MTAPLLELSNVAKSYGALRPLRIRDFVLSDGERVALLGFDQAAAEVFVNLITGATLPDAGDVRAFQTSTAAIEDSAAWLTTVDRFGIVSERVVLLEGLSALQNLALPFSLDIEPPPDGIRARAAALAAETGLAAGELDQRVAELDELARARIRLGRALALEPEVLLLEHASAPLDRRAAAALADTIASIAANRGVAVLAISADEPFARSLAPRVLTLDAATGRLDDRSRRGWFTRRRV